MHGLGLIFGLHILDVSIVVASMAAILIIGLRVSRGVKHGSDFFVGGRQIGSVLQFFLNFGMMADSNGAPTIATEVYRQGVGGMWIGFQTLFLTPFYWFSSIWFRRTRLVTGADLFVDRFASQRLAALFAALTTAVLVLQLALGNTISYKVAAAMIVKPPSQYTDADRRAIADFADYKQLKEQFVAGKLPPDQRERYDVLDAQNKRGELSSYISYVTPIPFYIVYTLIVGTYVMLGGLKAAAITDAFQGVLIIVLSVILIPLGLAKIGGLHALHQAVPDYTFRLFGTEAISEYAWYSILAIIFTSLVGIASPGGNASANASARDERAVRTGVISGAFGKRLIMIAWMFCGLLAVALFPGGVSDPDNVWGTLSYTLLAPGLMGIMISGMLLGHMPAVGGNAVNISALFTRNLYEPLAPNRSQRHYLLVAKSCIAAVLIAGVLLALFFSNVITILTTLITFGAYFGTVGLLIYYWRRLTAAAVEIGLVVWVVVMVLIPWVLPQIHSFREQPSLTLQTSPRTIDVFSPATPGDVAAGRADRPGQAIPKQRLLPPVAVFFEKVARQNPADPNSPPQGLGRFNVETYLLSRLGLPVQKFDAAGLLTARWLFDGILPFLMLVLFSYLTGGLRVRAKLDPDLIETASLASSVGLAVHPAQETQLRLARFYGKMKTPVASTPAEDQRQVTATFNQPDRFDHLKLFPNSCWEFTRWTSSDTLGFAACWAGVLAVLALLYLAVTAGS